MALSLALGVGLATWLLVSYVYPTILSQIPFGVRVAEHASLDRNAVITPQILDFIEKTMAHKNITGLSITLIAKSGETEFHSFGYRTEDGDKVTPDTLFNMASVSKAFCATAMGLLIDDFAHGNNLTKLPPSLTELTWHTRLADLLPGWQLMDEVASKNANLRDILTHMSGVPRHEFSYGPSDTPQDMVERLKYLRPAFELREQLSYNNIMYMVASHVIATYSGQSYTSFVERRIFKPLGMTSSTFSPDKAKETGRLTQGWSKAGRRVPEMLAKDALLALAGPGGVIASSIDMAKWISTWIHEGVHDNRTVIPVSVYRNVSYSSAIASGHPPGPDYAIIGYGMGWSRTSYRGHDLVSHNGGLPWVSTQIAFLPADQIGILLFANGEVQNGPLVLIQNRILDLALGLHSSPTPMADVQATPPTPEISTTDFGPTLSLDVLSGTYANPGYGSLALCSPSSTSAYCASVQSDFSAVDSVGGGSGSEDLLAAWPRMWVSHVRMRRRQGRFFDVYWTSVYPNGWGKDTTPFETSEIGQSLGLAEFVVEDGEVVGFGMSDMEGVLTERARTAETVQDRAEVWFEKVR